MTRQLVKAPVTQPSPITLFGHIAQLVSSCGSLSQLLDATVELIHEVMRVERCSIMLVDEASDSGRLYVAAATGMGDSPVASEPTPTDRGIAGEVFAEGKPRLGTAKRNCDVDNRYQTSTYIVCPIEHEGERIGVINITNRQDRRPFDQEDVELLASLSSVIGVAIGRARLAVRMQEVYGRLDRMVEGVPMGVLLVDKNDRIVQSNHRAVEFARIDKFVEGEPLDAPQHGIAGTVLAKLLYDARKDSIRTSREWTPSHMPPEHVSAELMRALADPDAPTFRFDAMEGETELPRPLRLSVELHGADGDALILLEDMTMNQAVHELRRLDEMKTSFISLVSHELRTPLTSLRGAVSLLTNFYNEGLSDTHKELLRIVGTSSDRLGGIVNMIIDTAMIEQQQLNLDMRIAPLENAINPVIEEAAKALSEKGLTVRKEYSSKGGMVNYDMDRITQAITAVFENAVKYARPNSSILVRLWLDAEGTFRLRIRNEGDPIPHENREKVFERFFQIDKTLTRNQGGTGLGLYLARQITILHGGLLEVLEDSDGATFEFVLPSADA